MAAKKKTATKTRLPKMPDPYEVGSKGLFRLVDETGKEVAQVPQLPAGLGVKLLEAMLFQRALDQRMLNLQRQGRIGFFVPSSGQEASQVGTGYAMDPDDWIYPSYRVHSLALLKGVAVRTLFDQLWGNATDAVKGRQMPNHFSLRGINWVSISSPIGTQISQAAGTVGTTDWRNR